MRRFLASAWFPFLTVLVFAGVSAAAFTLLPPGEAIANSELDKWMTIAGWAAGGVMALLAFVTMMILNGVRRLMKMRRKSLLHPVVVLLGLLPWMIGGWNLLLNEPRNTAFAKATIDLIGRQMFVGSFAAALFALILSIPLFFSRRDA